MPQFRRKRFRGHGVRIGLGLPEQRIEKAAAFRLSGSARRIVTRDHFAASAGPPARPRLEIVEVRPHPRDLRIDLAALGRRRRAEKQELPVLATDRFGVGDGSIDFGALPLGGGLKLGALARPRSIGDSLPQTLAIGALRKRWVPTKSRQPTEGGENGEAACRQSQRPYTRIRRHQAFASNPLRPRKRAARLD